MCTIDSPVIIRQGKVSYRNSSGADYMQTLRAPGGIRRRERGSRHKKITAFVPHIAPVAGVTVDSELVYGSF